MPITKNADGDHGYATTDFRDIAPDYGTLADFDELMRQAHRRGIGVVMDYVINHAAATHPMFQAALQGPGHPFRDWFVWSDTAPPGWDIWGKNPWYHTASSPGCTGRPEAAAAPAADARGFYFGTFGPHMPDFNFANPRCGLPPRQPALLAQPRARRLPARCRAAPAGDATPSTGTTSPKPRADQAAAGPDQGLPATLRGLRGHRQAAGLRRPPAVCGGAFAFGQVHHYVQAALGQPESVQKVADVLPQASPTMATFVSNHDIFAGRRLWDQVGGDVARYKLAAAGYLLQPGTPFIYYGEEIGQAGVGPACRVTCPCAPR
jgi:alpha-amylase